MIPLILAWLFFGLTAVNALTFIALYLAKVRPWHRRPGEPREVRMVRMDIFAWSGTVALIYLSSAIGFSSAGLHPSTAPERLAISAVVTALTAHRLVTYIRVNRRKRG